MPFREINHQFNYQLETTTCYFFIILYFAYPLYYLLPLHEMQNSQLHSSRNKAKFSAGYFASNYVLFYWLISWQKPFSKQGLLKYLCTIHKHLHQLSGPQECLKIWWSKSFCLCFYISAKIWSPSSSLFPTALPLLLTKVYLRASCYIFFHFSLMRSADEIILTQKYQVRLIHRMCVNFYN